MKNIDLPCFLVASPQLVDPIFCRSVILLLEHDKDGALGFVINNKSPLGLGEVVAFDQMPIPPGIPVWNAGPVDPSSGFILHNAKHTETDQLLAPGVFLSSSQQALKRLIEESAHPQAKVLYPYRLLIGYAGWGPGQLDGELKRGNWIQASLNEDLLFNRFHDQMWASTLESVGIRGGVHVVSQDAARWLH